jgi:hypothetical protein
MPCRRGRDPDLEAQALARRGEAYRVAGYYRDAGADLRTALAKAEQSADQALVAAASGALGNLAFVSRRTAVAEPLLDYSRDLARRLHDWPTLAASENDLGNLYASTGRASAAAQAYAAAIADAGIAGDATLAATAETNAARLALHGAETARDLALLTRAVAGLERLPPTFAAGTALIAAGSAVFETPGAIPAVTEAVADRAFRAASQMAEILHNPTLASLAEGSLGHLDERAGRVAAAASLTTRAAFEAQQAMATELSFRWDWQLARLARQRGETDLALATYSRAVAELQSIRQDIPVEYRDGRSSYRTTFDRLYLQFADLLLQRATARAGEAPVLIREARKHRRSSERNRIAGLFSGSLRFRLSRQTAFDRNNCAGYGGHLSDRAAATVGDAGQLRRRGPAVHDPGVGSDPAQRGAAVARTVGKAYHERVSGSGSAALRTDRPTDRAGARRTPCRHPRRHSRRSATYRAVRGAL